MSPYPMPVVRQAHEHDNSTIGDVVALLIDAANMDGGHHKQYAILQAVRLLVGDNEYMRWWKALEENEDYGPPDEGIP